jgi:hypothetical protein
MSFRNLHWPLILGLGALALVRPIMKTIQDQAGVASSPVLSIGLTVAITALWAVVVGLSQVSRPIATLVAAGLSYAVLSILLSGLLSPILTGRLQGPLATPVAIIPVLLTNAVWGAVAGVLALALQRRRRPTSTTGTSGTTR